MFHPDSRSGKQIVDVIAILRRNFAITVELGITYILRGLQKVCNHAHYFQSNTCSTKLPSTLCMTYPIDIILYDYLLFFFILNLILCSTVIFLLYVKMFLMEQIW